MGERLTTLTSLVHEPLEALAVIVGSLTRRRRGRRRRHHRIGLALSGGAARGIAHIGVLSVLFEAGIVPDLVAGTSAGAAAGALFCRGWSPEQMLRLVRGLNLLQLGRPSLRRPGLLDGSRFEDLFRDVVGNLSFADLPIPLAVVACDLLSGEEVVIREGALAPAVRASCSIPGIFTPVELDGELLVDGDMVNHVPISVLTGMGADYTIAVDVNPRGIPSKPPDSLFEVLAATYQIVIRKSCVDPDEQADCLICPETAEFERFRFGSQADDLYQAGRQAAEVALPRLQQDLERAR